MTLNETANRRFWAKVDIGGGDDDCWLWTGGKSGKGYGVFWAGKQVRATHASWMLAGMGEIGNMFVMHTCDNPPCVRPSHLRLGTPLDNMLDAKQKDRLARRSQHGRSRLTDEQVAWIRSSFSAGMTRRECATHVGASYANVARIVRGVIWK